MKVNIRSQELKYIVVSLAFAGLWFFAFLPVLLVSNLEPIALFAVANLGWYVFLVLFLKTFITKNKTNLKASLGIICIFLALDTWMPEYHVTSSGQLLAGADLGVSATDYIWGTIATASGLQGTWIFLFTYILVPVCLLVASALILPNFVKRLG